jgi:hypothetical protein
MSSLYEDSWFAITYNLDRLVDNLNSEKNEDENNFRQEVISVIENCKNDTGIPDIEQILVGYIKQKKDWHITYSNYLHDVRTHLTRNFTSMENGMSRKVEEAKEKVSQSLRESLNLGNIPQLVNLQGSQFLKKLVEIIPDDDSLKPLKQPLEALANFEMTYRNHIRSVVRDYLDNFNPNKTNMKLTQIPGGKEDTPEIKQKKAEEIQHNLEIIHGEVIFHCEVELPSKISSKPGKEILIEIEEFVDQITRSEGVKRAWEIFQYDQKFYIWPEEFGGDTQGNHRQQWLNAVEQVAQVNQLQALQFVN